MANFSRPVAAVAASLAWFFATAPAEAQSIDVGLSMTSTKTTVEVGDVLTLTVEIENGSNSDLTSADGRPAFVRIAPARGFDVLADTAVVSVGETRFQPSSGGVSFGNRLVRFGPIDLAAGGRATLSFRAVIGGDTRPGRIVTRARLFDRGGVALSPEATSTVAVTTSRGIESSIVIGRVFCDTNGDGAVSRGETGVFGARVYLDTGSFAVTDTGGLFHFTRVDEGTRLVKLDKQTLGASEVIGNPARLLRLTPGLPGKANFPVDCKMARVEGSDPQVTVSHATRPIAPADPGLESTIKRRLVVAGDLLLLAVTLDGGEIALPSASAGLEASSSVLEGGSGANLKPPPTGGYGVDRPKFVLGFEAPTGVVGTRWNFVIKEASARRKPFFALAGNGGPPTAIDWDGRGSDGRAPKSDTLYVAQLVVIGSRAKIEAASALVPFGIGYGTASRGPTSLTWRGKLFRQTVDDAPGRPSATEMLRRHVTELAATIAKGDRIEIASHEGTAKSRVEALATTQERADAVRDLLIAAGVDGAAIVSRGRGVAEPVATGGGANETNRRVEVRVARAASSNTGSKVPSAIAIGASALIDGQPAEVGKAGRFLWQGAVPARGALLIDVQARDGRRASIDVALGKDAGRANQRVRKVTVRADLARAELTVGNRVLEPALLDLDLTIDKNASGAVSVAAKYQPALKPKRIVAVISEAGGTKRRLVLDSKGRAAVPADTAPAAVVQLIAETANGSRAYSPVRQLADGERPRKHGGELLINGVAWPVAGARAEGPVEVPVGGALLVDATRPSGQRAIYVVVLAGAGEVAVSGGLSPDQPQMPSSGDSKRDAVTRGELLASKAADFWVELPKAGATVATRLAIRGRGSPQAKITINGDSIQTARDGLFSLTIEIPPGASDLRFSSTDAQGYRAELKWPVKARRTSTFAIGLAELVVATSATERGLLGDTAYLAGMSPDTTVSAGPLLIHGRATLYLKSELRPSRAFERVSFTAHLDTSKRKSSSAFFEDVLNPVRDEPVLGDSAVEVRDVNGRGKLYVKLEADDSKVIVGSLAAELGGGELFRYGRTVDGAGINIDRTVGSARVGLDAFATTTSADSVRDHVVYRATGGTLYYLRYADLLEGSELLRVIVRDRDSGTVASERLLQRNVDYTIDYLSGRVWLIDPVASIEESSWLLSNSDSSLTPRSGNPVYIEARYEHRDLRNSGEKAAGAEAQAAVGPVRVTGGVAKEWRAAGVADYRLWGATASYAPGERSRVQAEVAGSSRREGDVELSIDGGLSFRDLGWAEAIENPNQDSGRAWRLGAKIAAGDFSEKLEGVEVSAYAKTIDRSFSSTSTELERGRLKLGGTIKISLGSRDSVMVRHQAEISEVPRIGPTIADVPTVDRELLDERATFLTSVGWVGERGALTHRVEAAHHRLTSTAARADGSAALDARRVGVGGRSSLALGERLSIDLFQELWAGVRDIDPTLSPIDPNAPTTRIDEPLAGVTTGIGLAWKLLPDARITSELRQRWNGDQSASVGLHAKLSELGSFYVAERAVRTDDGPAAVTVIGADDRFGPGGMGRSYGEYQIRNTGSSARNRAILGLGRKWRPTRKIGLGLGLEHQQVFGGFLPDGTPVGNNQRDLIRASLDLAPTPAVRLSIVSELRADRSHTDDDVDRDLVNNDPRDPSGQGFADHGGVAPGAPLVLADGKQTQLVSSAGLAWRPQDGVSLFGRGRMARTWVGPAVGFTELTGGLAYRSLLDDRLALLIRYSFLSERRPEATELERETAHVFAVVPVADLTNRWRLSGKLAFKRSEVSGGLADAARINAFLAVVRIGYRLYGNWDATLEGRALALSADDRELKLGSLVELGYYFSKFLRLGIGYNFSHFNDQELGDLTRDAHGLFFRLTAEI